MYLIREVFNARPGKAKELVRKFKEASRYFEKDSMKNFNIMTDVATTYWTVVMEHEVDDLGQFAKDLRGGGKPMPEVEKIMEGYMELVEGGHREIYLIE
jgi:hypothetical protein